jgi:hypothetical protein
VVSTTALATRQCVFGEWRNGHFAYNTACTNLDKTAIHNPDSDGVILTKSTLEKYGVSYVGRLGGPGESSHLFSRGKLQDQPRRPEANTADCGSATAYSDPGRRRAGALRRQPWKTSSR